MTVIVPTVTLTEPVTVSTIITSCGVVHAVTSHIRQCDFIRIFRILYGIQDQQIRELSKAIRDPKRGIVNPSQPFPIMGRAITGSAVSA